MMHPLIRCQLFIQCIYKELISSWKVQVKRKGLRWEEKKWNPESSPRKRSYLSLQKDAAIWPKMWEHDVFSGVRNSASNTFYKKCITFDLILRRNSLGDFLFSRETETRAICLSLHKYIFLHLMNHDICLHYQFQIFLLSKNSSFIFIFNLENIVYKKCKQATSWQQV